jgi:hypothetical protein
MVLMAVSGETPEWPGSARSIGQSENEVALALPATVNAPARATPAAVTSAGLNEMSFDISVLLALVDS